MEHVTTEVGVSVVKLSFCINHVNFREREIEMSYEAFMELARIRRSIRKFKPDPVTDDEVKKIIEAASLAPSGFNCQLWEFVVVRKQEYREAIGRKGTPLCLLVLPDLQPRPLLSCFMVIQGSANTDHPMCGMKILIGNS
jgi:hypothetical protein